MRTCAACLSIRCARGTCRPIGTCIARWRPSRQMPRRTPSRFARWCEAVYARLTALRHMAAADALRRERKVRPGFHQWRLEARWRRHLSQSLPRQMRRRMAKRLQLRGFARWRAEQLLSQSSRLSMALRRRCLLRKMRRALALWLRRCDPTTLDARLRRRHKRWPVLVGGSAENLGWQPPKAVFKMKHGINSMSPAQRKLSTLACSNIRAGFGAATPMTARLAARHVQRVPLSRPSRSARSCRGRCSSKLLLPQVRLQGARRRPPPRAF